MNKHRPFPDVNKVHFSVSVFEDQRLERTDFAVVHDSPSIGAGPSVVLFFFENMKIVNHQTRFCPRGLPSSESYGSYSVSLNVSFLFM